ncbi:DUF3310 domain-containing protein [Lactobacillus terrae]|uniref:DUF3310 domain-containing protein n=1 Tax=Lactobacillus terrae TaxID=2269374 RepID=UPI000C1B7B30|nr:DUF3310 domain-containing protein [Lactobacillus terrae]
MNKSVEHPSHYTHGSVEVIDAMKAMTEEEYRGYLRGNAIKYLFRSGYKDDPVQDLEKAKTYIDWMVEGYQKSE